jgi:hypothetical protein
MTQMAADASSFQTFGEALADFFQAKPGTTDLTVGRRPNPASVPSCPYQLFISVHRCSSVVQLLFSV